VKGCRNATPTVTVRNGTYAGLCNANYKQDFFLGIPFAQVCSADPILVALGMIANSTRPLETLPLCCCRVSQLHVGRCP
jgi:hypothetical protein